MANQAGIDLSGLISVINDRTNTVKSKLDEIKSRSSSTSIGDMFDLQILMNSLSQMSEAATSVTSASNSAVASMARNVKG